MSSHAQDQGTQTAASTGAQQNDAVLDANATANQNFANQTRTTLFGTYNPTTNQYSGGTESGFLDPSKLNETGLNGAYANEYNTAADETAQGAKNAVGTTMQNLADRGLGKTPTGFSADQQRQAYQTQAGENASNYTGLFGAQHAEDLNNFTNASNLLNSSSTGAANLSLQGNTAAAGNYNGLYGTASTQVANPWATAAGALGSLGSVSYAPCWVAAELWGGWLDPRTVTVRAWLLGPVSRTAIGRWVVRLYTRFGPRLAAEIRVRPLLRRVFRGIFDMALKQARKAGA